MPKALNLTSTEAAAEAAALVKRTAEETATALNIQFMQKDIAEIKATMKELVARDGIYVQRSDFDALEKRSEGFVAYNEFVFWRNLLVSGILLTIALGVIINLVTSALR